MLTHTKRCRRHTVLTAIIAILATGGAVLPAARAEEVLHPFRVGADGRAPYGRLLSDRLGNLYGATSLGGKFGAGIVFELTPPVAPGGDWTEEILYNFTGGADGSQPYSGLIFDSAGALYGTTYRGGASLLGTVYQLTPPATNGGTWTEAVLHSFAGGSDGAGPQGDLIFDGAGNLYGTATSGGTPGGGIVFELTPPNPSGSAWSETVLRSFRHAEGISPRAALVFGPSGALYGTLANGGASDAGAVFRLNPPATPGGHWIEQTLYSFQGGADGSGPLSTLLLVNGNLYGTTVIGGASSVGTVFELLKPPQAGGEWAETVLHSFACGSDGCYPWAGLSMDQNGAFFGTTQFGGLPSNGGTVFEIKPTLGSDTWTETILYSFKYSANHLCAAGVIFGNTGGLYGATIGAGMKTGMVFEVPR